MAARPAGSCGGRAWWPRRMIFPATGRLAGRHNYANPRAAAAQAGPAAGRPGGTGREDRGAGSEAGAARRRRTGIRSASSRSRHHRRHHRRRRRGRSPTAAVRRAAGAAAAAADRDADQVHRRSSRRRKEKIGAFSDCRRYVLRAARERSSKGGFAWCGSGSSQRSWSIVDGQGRTTLPLNGQASCGEIASRAA